MKHIRNILGCLVIGLLALGSQESLAARSNTNLSSVIEGYFQAFNRHDVDTLVNFYADDAVMEDPESPAPSRGRTAIREHFQQMFSMIPDVQDHVKNTVIQNNKVAVEFVSTGTVSSKKEGEKGNPFTLPVVSILEFKNGKIVRKATYYDTAAVR